MRWPAQKFANQPMLFQTGTAILVLLAVIKLLIHFLTNDSYGFHRDEVYYIDCGKNLDFGFVDHPPFTPLVAHVSLLLFGDSLFALRFFPALAGAGIVLLTGLIARSVGGNSFAQILAAVAVLVTPRYLHANGMLQPVSFDQFFWVLAIFLILQWLNTDNPKYWPWIGLVIGIGAMNKHTMLFFCFGILVGILLTRHRRVLGSLWFWLGVLLASVIFLPNLVWQIRHGWPTVEFLQYINQTKMSQISLYEFLVNGQLKSQQILLFPLWLAGLFYFFFDTNGKKYRLFGWMYVSILILFLIVKAKPYYLGPAYPVLLAGGSVFLEKYFIKGRTGWQKPVFVLAIAILCILNLPNSALPIHPISETTNNDYKDMVGWNEMVSSVASAYDKLSDDEKKACIIFTGNYGEAGCINFLGKKYGLPQAFSAHNSHWIWGPPSKEPSVVIVLGAGEKEDLLPHYEEVVDAGTITNRYGVQNEEYGQHFYVCRGPRFRFREVWPGLKHYD